MSPMYLKNLATYQAEYANFPVFHERQLERENFRHIADGNDSSVFLVDGKIFKKYDSDLQRETLLAYAELIGKTAQSARENADRYSGHLTTFQNPTGYKFVVNPVDFMGNGYFTYKGLRVDAPTFLMTVSEYVPGPRLDRFVWYRGMERSETELKDNDTNGMDQQEINVLNNLFLASIDERSVRKELDGLSTIITSLLEEDTGYSGLRVGDTNIKVRYDIASHIFTFVITDLCSSLEELRKE